MLIDEHDRPTNPHNQSPSRETFSGPVTQVAKLVGAVSLVPPGVEDGGDEGDVMIEDGMGEERTTYAVRSRMDDID